MADCEGVDVADSTKRCSKCREWKPLSEFYGDKRKRDGKVSRCKPCANAQRLASVERNREHYRAYMAAWYESSADAKKAKDAERYLANRDKRVEQIKAWSANNPEARRRSAAESYRRNRDAVLQRTRERAQANPEYRAEVSRRRRARVAKATIGEVDLTALWVDCDGICYLCGIAIDADIAHPDPMSKSLDHILPLSKGGSHTQENLAWTHTRCNVRKGANDGRVHLPQRSRAVRSD